MSEKFLTLLLLISSISSVAQDSVGLSLLQPFRFEKEQKFSDNEFTIISLREDGLALLRDKNKFKSGNKSWELILLDTTLQELHTLELDIDQRKNLVGYEQVPGYVYILFRSADNLKLVLDLIAVQVSNAEITRHEINPELVLRLSHFIKVADNFVLGGYVNNEPTVLLYNPAAENIKVLPGFFQKQTELIDIRPNQNQTFNTILINRSDRSHQNLIFKTFDAHGLELLEDIVPIDENYILQTGMSSMLILEDLTIIGTWGSRGNKQSHGFFSVPINPFAEQRINYTAFGELNHYLDGQNPKRAKKIKDRTQEALKQNRIPDFTNYVMPYKIEEHPHGFILLAETYTASNTLNRYPDPYMYGFAPHNYYSPFWGYYPGTYNRLYNPYYFNNRNNVRNSDEIKVVQSVLVAFDNEGKPSWDYSLELKDIRTQSLDQVSDFCIVNNTIYYMFKKDSELVLRTINLDTEESADFSVKIKLNDEAEEIRSENKNTGTIRHWYGRNFYVWGQHTIRTKAKREDGTRQVFYVNKVVVP